MLSDLYKKLPEKALKSERFEPPTFSSAIQGKQTMISNFTDVADDLRRDANHLLKYISKEMATSGNVSGHRAILQGKFGNGQLNSRLENYIKEYILCNECGKPDTSFVTVQGIKNKQCEVCGARAPVKAI